MLEPDRLYTVDELATVLHVHPQTVYRWLREGKVRRAVRPGRKVLLLGKDILTAGDDLKDAQECPAS